MSSRLFSRSTVYFLRQLLEEFHRGEIILPRFHRPLVWDSEKRLELFDSIRKGIPLGSFTIWETHADVIKPMAEFGPFVLPKASKRSPYRYLIDGEQRLMTLYLALYNVPLREDASLDESVESFEVFFDIDEQVFVAHEERPEEEDEPSLFFPLHGLFEFRNTLRFQRKLARHLAGEQFKQSIERVDGVVEALKECNIAVTTVVTDDPALATEVFKRVNSQGVAMSTVHMLNAMTWQDSPSLLDSFDSVRSSMESFPFWQYAENLSNELLLRVAKRLLGCDVDEENTETLATEFQASNVFERLEQTMQRTAAFLHGRGLRNPAHVPDEWMLVMLGKVFDEVPEPSSNALNRIEDWLWFIAYTESFDRSNRSATYRSLEAQAITLAQGKRLRSPPVRQRKPLPLFEFSKTRSKAFAWMLAQRMMAFDEGHAADVLAEYGVHCLLQIRNPITISSAHTSAVRVLCHPVTIGVYRSGIRSGSVDRRILDAQVLSTAALAKLRADPPYITGFVNIRERELNELEDARFAEILERLFPA